MPLVIDVKKLTRKRTGKPSLIRIGTLVLKYAKSKELPAPDWQSFSMQRPSGGVWINNKYEEDPAYPLLLLSGREVDSIVARMKHLQLRVTMGKIDKDTIEAFDKIIKEFEDFAL